MATFKITAPDGKSYNVDAPDDASQEDVLAYAQKNYKMAAAPVTPAPSKPWGQRMNEEISNIPRQIGLTARYGIEGIGDTLDFLSSPFRGAMNMVMPKQQNLSGLVTGEPAKDAIASGSGRYLANKLSLPTPETPTERMVGDASRLIAGSAIPLGAANKLASATSGTTQAVSKMMGANPGMQIGSAGAAGLAGGYTRETGGDDTSQLLSSLAAGVAAPLAAGGVQRLAQGGANAFKSMTTPAAAQNVQIDVVINNALKASGLSLADIPANVAASLRNDVAAATKIGNLSPDAVRRLADYRLIGAQPKNSTLSLDPAAVSQEKNLAKLGINSKDVAAQQLGQIENSNNRVLIEGLNGLGAGTADDAMAGGQRVMGALQGRIDANKANIGSLYETARGTSGRSAALDPSAFTQQANNLLDDALLGGKLPSDVRNLLNRAATGEMPLTVDVAEQFKTRIGELQRASSDMAERKALGLVRSALDDTPLLEGQGQQAIDAFNKARGANRAWMQTVEKTPALQAVMDGVEPDKFVQQYIIGGGTNANTMDLAMLKKAVRQSPEAMDAIKSQITAYLKNKASNGAADEVANFSQSAFNKALNGIGDRKLGMFFPKEELAQLRAIGRVSSYEQFQPRGAAVNNSNTAGAGLATLFDRIGNSPLLSKIPFGSTAIGEPLQNISIGMQSKRALNVPQSLATGTQQPRLPQGLMMSPAMFGMDFDEDRRNRGLLAP